MGIRAKILWFVGILTGVALAQMVASLWVSRQMGENLRDSAGEVIESMGESIRKNESERVGMTMVANTSDLKALMVEVERSVMMAADFVQTAMETAAVSAANSRLAEKEIGEFCVTTVRDRLPAVTGMGFSFEIDGFSPFQRYYMPFAYREDGGIEYSDELTAPDGVDVAALPDSERDKLVGRETALEYYSAVVPVDHDRSKPLPVQAVWSEPYIDAVTQYLTISVSVPLVRDNRVVGVAFIDMSLNDLDGMTAELGRSITPGAQAMTFDFVNLKALSAPGQSNWMPQEVDDPDAPGQKKLRPSLLADDSLGREIIRLAGQTSSGHVSHREIVRDGRDYTLYVGNLRNLFGLAVMVPDDELFADTRKALARSGELREQQQGEMAKLTIVGAVSLFAMLLTCVLVVLFVVRLTRGMAGIVANLNRDASGVSGASDTMNGLSRSLASETADQASALASTAAALGDISEKVKANADASDTCDKAMRAVSERVDAGANQVRRMTEAMDGISTSSEKISQIIKTIESISFQTNLLALNAAVEASRAGEAGKGFAVVADEVRNLAQRSAQATRETAELIAETTSRVANGTLSVSEMEAGFKEILSAVAEAAGWFGRIRESTAEQADAIVAINGSVKEMDAAVKRNEQMASQSASTAVELAEQAMSLSSTAVDLNRLTAGSA